MEVQKIDIDSVVIGKNVLTIHDFNQDADFMKFERSYLQKFNPYYVSCKVALENITAVHLLENYGFNLIECQIRSSLNLRKPYDVSRFDYKMLPVTRQEELDEVLDIAATTFTHDRFSIDSSIDSTLSGMRYREYVKKSFQSPNEAVYRLVSPITGQTVAFKTHLYMNNNEVLCLLGGVHPEKKNLGLGVINTYFELNELIQKGVKKITTHISASNYPIFNLEIGHLGFKVVTTFAVLRKLYV